MNPARKAAAVAAALFVAACGDSPNGPDGPGPRLELMSDAFDAPTHIAVAPGDARRLFVVEKTGRIRVLVDGVLRDEPFLDIRSLVATGPEQGLLSVAFHPDYAANGRFFVYYTNGQEDTRVVEYRVASDPDRADPASARTVLPLDQPFPPHNGGLLLFGPDGHLYIGLGDGGSFADEFGHAQDPGTLLGAILRIDVDGGEPYAIPADNPFVGVAGARPEVWAYGLRNPWRFSFDRATGDLYLTDVGQLSWEEVNIEPADSPGGINYGWNVMEGTHCFATDPCDTEGSVLPVYEYDHDEGCSVIGGYVYRGDALPALRGAYVFGDHCGGWIRSFRYSGAGEITDVRDWSGQLGKAVLWMTSFGEDADGELYIASLEGSVYRLASR